MEGEWRDMINDRIEDCTAELRKKNEMFRAWCKRSQELRMLIEDFTMEENDRKLLEEFLATEFNIAAVIQPAFYRKGMEDAVCVIKTLGVL